MTKQNVSLLLTACWSTMTQARSYCYHVMPLPMASEQYSHTKCKMKKSNQLPLPHIHYQRLNVNMLNLTKKVWPLYLESRNSISICLVISSASTQTINLYNTYLLNSAPSYFGLSTYPEMGSDTESLSAYNRSDIECL